MTVIIGEKIYKNITKKTKEKKLKSNKKVIIF